MRFPEKRRAEATRIHRIQKQQIAEPAIDYSDNPTVPSPNQIEAKVAELQDAWRLGQRQRAYQLSRELTQLAPDKVEGWLYLAALTDVSDERFSYLNKALSLAPEQADARQGMYQTLKFYLEHDPFLRYMDETDSLYQVLNGAGHMIVVPKDRAPAPHYPPAEPSPLRPVFRWLIFALVGLPLAGLVTVVCALIAAARAWRLLDQPLNVIQRRRTLLALVYASILWMIGLVLSFLFLIHLL